MQVTYTLIKLICVSYLKASSSRDGNERGRPVGTVAKPEHGAIHRSGLHPARPWPRLATPSRFSKEAGKPNFYMKLDFF